MSSIITTPDPRLNETCTAVDIVDIVCGKWDELIHDMRAELIANDGVGIAAPQLGVFIQLIIIRDTKAQVAKWSERKQREFERSHFDSIVMFNPTVTRRSTGTVVGFEGCLSVPGMVGAVKRPRTVGLVYITQHGRRRNFIGTGWPGRIAAHEADHLEGRLYTRLVLPGSFMTVDKYRANWIDKSPFEILRDFPEAA